MDSTIAFLCTQQFLKYNIHHKVYYLGIFMLVYSKLCSVFLLCIHAYNYLDFVTLVKTYLQCLYPRTLFSVDTLLLKSIRKKQLSTKKWQRIWLTCLQGETKRICSISALSRMRSLNGTQDHFRKYTGSKLFLSPVLLNSCFSSCWHLQW